jgi:Phosphodiester glycosidase/Copper amine oxidase N-terminal domain
VRNALAVLGLFGLALSAQAAPFSLALNGVALETDVPLVDGGEALLSASAISHHLGIAVLPTRTAGMWVVSAFGRQIYVRANTTRYLREGGEAECVHPPVLRGGQLYVPVSLLADNFGLHFTRPGDARLEVTGPGAEVQDIRPGNHPDFVRVVIDVSQAACFRWTQDATTVSLWVPAEGAGPKTFRKLTHDDPLVPEIMQEPAAGGGTNVVIGHRSPGQVLIFTLADPARIVVDVPRQAPQQPGLPQAPPDIEYVRRPAWEIHRVPGALGTAVAYVVTLPAGKARLRPALASDTVWGAASVSSIASRFGAFAGLNGGFYAIGGGPLGMVLIDGEWITEPILGRTVLGIMRDGSAQMANVRFDGRVTLPGVGTVRIDALNRGHSDGDEVVLYTQRWGAPTAHKPGATRVMLAPSGEVLLVNDEGRGMEIPTGGYVLSAVGPRARQIAKAQKGTLAAIQLSTDPAWPGLVHALGGGPRLVANGRVYVTSGTEHFRSDVVQGAAPRSAVALMPNGDVLLVAVDGRQSGYSAGLTLHELASFLVRIGARDAMNFDGGGSTTLVAAGQLANRPCDGSSRRVSNALLAFHVAG